MRIFVPVTLADVAALHRDGSLPVRTGYAVTDRYRAAVGAEIADDDEVLDYDVMTAAAEASFRKQPGGPGRRRVVLAVDLPAEPDPEDPASGRVLVDGPVELRDVAAVHVDDARLDAAEEPDADLSWYAPQEIPDLLAD